MQKPRSRRIALFALLQKKIRNDGLLGVTLNSSGVALAHVGPARNATPPHLMHCEYQPLGEADDPFSVLRTRIQQLKLGGLPLSVALHSNDYSLQMVEAPQVPAEELRQAMRWQMKDRFEMDINEMVIDVFEIPGLAERGKPPQVYVVASQQDTVSGLIRNMQAANLNLQVIDIPEMAQRNIAFLHEADRTGVAVLNLGDTSGALTLSRQGILYLARDLEQGGYALRPEPVQLASGSEELALTNESPQRQYAIDAIVLEIQRSLDYYESHFAQPPVSRLIIAAQMELASDVVDVLSGMLGLSIELMDLNPLMTVEQPLSEGVQYNCMTAIGLALRGHYESQYAGEGDATH